MNEFFERQTRRYQGTLALPNKAEQNKKESIH